MASTPHHCLKALSLGWPLGAGKAGRTHVPRIGVGCGASGCQGSHLLSAPPLHSGRHRAVQTGLQAVGNLKGRALVPWRGGPPTVARRPSWCPSKRLKCKLCYSSCMVRPACQESTTFIETVCDSQFRAGGCRRSSRVGREAERGGH